MIRFLVALCAVTLFATPASAHLLPAQSATMNIVGHDAYIVVSAPASAFFGIDDDSSGGLSLLEIKRHEQDIASQFTAHFHVSETNNPAETLPVWVSSPQADGEPVDQRYVVILLRMRFAHMPNTPTVSTDLFGSGPGEGQMTLSATRGKTAEVAILTPDAPSHTYFRGLFATFSDFIRVGITHILTGPDHLLFLLTVIVAAAGWRYWLSVVTTFTVAHSITLTLATMRVVQVPTAIVEPGIAASIVFMAVCNLLDSRVGSRAISPRQLALVFACGLLHGLGFASAITGLVIDGSHRLATLVGFNIGIEMGQFIFLGTVLGLAGLAMRLVRKSRFMKDGSIRFAQLASLCAGALGSVMFVERTLPMLPHLL